MINLLIKPLVLCGFLITLQLSAMDRISSLANYVTGAFTQNPETTDRAVLDNAMRAFDVNEQDVFNKIVYGYFVDAYVSNHLEEHETTTKLGYGWFAGSITARVFVAELEQFLASGHSKRLRKETQNAIRAFITAVNSGQWQGEAIDALRAQTLSLGLIAATGNSALRSLVPESLDSAPIDELAQKAYHHLTAMREGEKELHLIGSLLHDTRLLFEKLADGKWRVREYDSGGLFFGNVHEWSIDNKDVISFLYGKYKAKFGIRADFAFKRIEQPSASLATMPSQTDNTCHFRGLLLALKDFVVRGVEMPLDEALLEWPLFEVALGEFWLDSQKIQDEKLLFYCKKQQKEFEENLYIVGGLRKHLSLRNSDDVARDYISILNLIGHADYGLMKISPELGNFGKLLLSHNKIIDKLKISAFNEELVNRFIDAPNIALVTTNKIKDNVAIKLSSFVPQLQNELKQCDSNFDSCVTFLKSSFSEACKENHWYNIPIYLGIQRKVAFSLTLANRELLKYLSILEANPHYLVNLQFKPQIGGLLMQALQNGFYDKIEAIYLKLDDEQQNKFYEYFQYSMCPDSLCVVPGYISNIITYLQRNPESKIEKLLLSFARDLSLNYHPNRTIILGDNDAKKMALLQKLFGKEMDSKDRGARGLFDIITVGKDHQILVINDIKQDREAILTLLSKLLPEGEARNFIVCLDAESASLPEAMGYAKGYPKEKLMYAIIGNSEISTLKTMEKLRELINADKEHPDSLFAIALDQSEEATDVVKLKEKLVPPKKEEAPKPEANKEAM